MKALTIWQPWASLCVISRPVVSLADLHEQDSPGGSGPRPFKTIETRSWKAPDSLIGQRIAIHAAKRTMNWVELQQIGFGQRSVVRPGSPRPIGLDYLTLDGVDVIDLHAVPYGAVVGTAVLAGCVTIVGCGEVINNPRPARPPFVVDTAGLGGELCFTTPENYPGGESVESQRPFGHFEPGRWAWLLADAERFDEPIPATGRQGLWNWEQSQ